MANVTQIRAALAGGPLKPSEIADKLGAETQKERTALYQAVTQLVNKQRGVERMDDGRIILVPGWKPTRGPGTGGAKTKPAKAPKAPKVKAPDSKPSQAPDPGPSPTAAAEAPAAPPPKAPTIQTVTMSRRHVRLLVAAVLAWGEELSGELKEAVVTGTVLSA